MSEEDVLSMVLALCLSLPPASALAAEGSADIVILYTNDIHTYIDNNAGEGNADGLTCSDAFHHGKQTIKASTVWRFL